MIFTALKSKKYSFNEKINNDINLSIDVDLIYKLIFKNYNTSIGEIGNKIYELENMKLILKFMILLKK